MFSILPIINMCLININIIYQYIYYIELGLGLGLMPSYNRRGVWGRKRPQVRFNMALLSNVLSTSNYQYVYLINLNIIFSICVYYIDLGLGLGLMPFYDRRRGLGGGSVPRLGLIWP